MYARLAKFRRPFRPRFSLLTALLVTALVACGITIWQMGKEIVPLREEVRQLRNLTGQLTITDPDRVHAVRAQTVEPDFWRWRFYIPPSPTYYLHTRPFKVPKTGVPEPTGLRDGSPLLPGEHFMELRFFPSENAPNELIARIKGHGGGNVRQQTIVLKERDQRWIKSDVTGGRTDGWANTLLACESVGPDEPMILFRLRAADLYLTGRDKNGRPTGSGVRVFDQPCDGLMIWIDRHRSY